MNGDWRLRVIAREWGSLSRMQRARIMILVRVGLVYNYFSDHRVAASLLVAVAFGALVYVAHQTLLPAAISSLIAYYAALGIFLRTKHAAS